MVHNSTHNMYLALCHLEHPEKLFHWLKKREHPTFCVIIDESHIAVTQNIGCSPLLSLYTYRIDSSSQYGGVFPLEA